MKKLPPWVYIVAAITILRSSFYVYAAYFNQGFFYPGNFDWSTPLLKTFMGQWASLNIAFVIILLLGFYLQDIKILFSYFLLRFIQDTLELFLVFPVIEAGVSALIPHLILILSEGLVAVYLYKKFKKR